MTIQNCSINYCKNNGVCYTNSTSNNDSWWCVCSPCITGPTCELKNHLLWTNPPTVMNIMIRESSLNYRALLICCISVMVIIGLINNFLALSTFLNSKSIRLSYKGIYLISYCICSIYVMIYIEIRYIITLYGSESIKKSYYYQYIYDCYIGIRLNTIFIAASMWYSSILAVERTLLELFFFKLFGITRKHAFIILLLVLIFCTSGRISTMLSVRIVSDPKNPDLFICASVADIKLLSTVELIFVWINAGGTCFLHFLANILALISIAQRKLYLSRNKLTLWKSWCTQISQHRDYFIPPTVILFSQLGNLLYFEIGTRYACIEPKFDVWSHIHLFVSFLNFVPQTITFLIFIYPSKTYMKEFYSNTIVGKWLLKLKEKCTCHTVNIS